MIAALELLATLIGVRLWVPEGQTKQTSRVAIKGHTDNQSNESLLKVSIDFDTFGASGGANCEAV